MLPPEAGDRRDQESDLEEVSQNKEKEYKPAVQLQIEENDADVEEEPNSPPSKRRSNVSQNWVKTSKFDKPIESCELSLSQTLVNEFDSFAFKIWMKIFTPDVIEMLDDQTNLYANRDKNNPRFSVKEHEMRTFLGILLISGYHELPQENHYWSTQQV